MKRRYFAVVPLLSIALLGSPGLAETPSEAVVDAIRAANVQQLILTNACYQCDLVGVDLSEAHLIGADLREAILVGADLSWSNLEGADLTKANLTGSDLTGAFLTNASLAYANLDHVNFTQAQLYHVDVTGASMENLNLADATVVGTPISIGGSTEPMEEELPVLTPKNDNNWQLLPPDDLWFQPWQHPGGILDVPLQVIPQA